MPNDFANCICSCSRTVSNIVFFTKDDILETTGGVFKDNFDPPTPGSATKFVLCSSKRNPVPSSIKLALTLSSASLSVRVPTSAKITDSAISDHDLRPSASSILRTNKDSCSRATSPSNELNPTSSQHGSIDNGELGIARDKLVPSASRPYSFTNKEPEAATDEIEPEATINKFKATVDELGADVDKLTTPGGDLRTTVDELVTSGSELGAAVDELGIFNDELGAAVDELATPGADLRTTSYELGTSGSELGAAVDKLGIFNDELRVAVDELATPGADLRTTSDKLGIFNGELGAAVDEFATPGADLRTTVDELGISGGEFKTTIDELPLSLSPLTISAHPSTSSNYSQNTSRPQDHTFSTVKKKKRGEE
ncbi:hypothetical protein F2Q69_00040349 [Brassica cretica]|uniref:Uncharacterized protein n=1 Tax=Brassica cretica TaxID=69181 RepID=A0A8S9N9Q6_BRACR|nr:hypothetical protein F2Q69_00040349 [Brassica cretica]